MRLRLRERWKLLVYNWIKTPYSQFFIVWPRWVAEGRDPRAMRRFCRGRLTLTDLDWAAAEARKIIDGPPAKTVPFEEFRARVRAMRRATQPKPPTGA